MTTLPTMTRREWTQQIAFEWVTFDRDVTERHGADQPRQPLDRRFAVVTGRSYIESGRYVPRRGSLDYARVAYEARRHVPRIRRMLEDA
jgi:hypothetical protein